MWLPFPPPPPLECTVEIRPRVLSVSTSDHVVYHAMEGPSARNGSVPRRSHRTQLTSARTFLWGRRVWPRGRRLGRIRPCLAAPPFPFRGAGPPLVVQMSRTPSFQGGRSCSCASAPKRSTRSFACVSLSSNIAVFLRSRSRVTRGQRYFLPDRTDRNAPRSVLAFVSDRTRRDPGWVRGDRQLAIFHLPQRQARGLLPLSAGPFLCVLRRNLSRSIGSFGPVLFSLHAPVLPVRFSYCSGQATNLKGG